MSQSKTRTHYVGAVPAWLADKVIEGMIPHESLLSYEKLSSIISPQDVCFYHEYLVRTNVYTDGLFDDMCTVAQLPENLAWLDANVSAAKTAADQFAYSFAKHANDLNDRSVPITVRRFGMIPMAVGTNSLLLLCSRGEELSFPELSNRCITELDKQMTFEEYKGFNVFRAYCQ